MKTPVLNLFDKSSAVKRIFDEIKFLDEDKHKLNCSSLHGSSKQLLVHSLFPSVEKILILCSSTKIVNETKVELDILGLSKYVVAIDNIEKEGLQESLTDLSDREKLILVADYKILQISLPSKEEVKKNTTKLEVGSEITYDDLIEYLNLLNYNRDKYVDTPGDFAVRGSIIDFWSFSEKHPCRIEYDGDFLESIRFFDPDSQRSSGRIEFVTVASSLAERESEKTSDIFEYLENPLIIASSLELKGLYDNTDTEKNEIIIEELDEELNKELFEENVKKSEIIEEKEDEAKLSYNELFTKNAKWLIEEEIGSSDQINLKLSAAPPVNSNFEVLFSLLTDYAGKGFNVFLTTENELQARRITDLLSEFKPKLKELLEDGIVRVTVLPIKEGFILRDEKAVILSDYQVFNKPYRTRISTKKKQKKSRIRDLASIKHGDFVVHENFGIGKYSGLETIKIGMAEQESIKILYAEGGVVYVNLNYLGLVKKYSSKDNAAPRLSVLGGNEWKNTKKKVKQKIKEAARELISLYAKRKASTGYPFSADSIWQKELEASFLYEDTPDQSKVSEQVKEDMESENPMDRLVCGDVGFGKTEIAVRAAFKSVNDGKQVALLVPTTILAEQHYNTFRDRLQQFPVKVAALSRFQNKPAQKEILEGLVKGTVDIVIGTHRLLSKDIEFKDLGLLIIDEEHRFGVMAKEKLRRIKANVDTLTLTATPIPRTLNLSLLGARDLSIMATPPPNRQPIYTKVEVFDVVKIREWVMSEIQRGGQIYFVHDRVQSIDKIAYYIQKHIPEISIGVAHGQMKPSQLEKVIHDFLNREYHMLMSTKIIESGLDIPNVNTIIVNRADRFGLAELHQLRGRVGRSDKQAYAHLLVPSLNTITKKAVRRLQAIEEYTELGEGFNLSMRDLEIRGAGNLLGTEQSGAIDTVGFDLYVKMLDEAVEELKQDEFSDIFKELPKITERSEPTIDTYFEVGIPKEYMPDQSDRLSFYTALFSMMKIDELDEIVEEMEDRFGKKPVIVDRLIQTAVLRFYASVALFERIIIQRNKITVIMPKAEREEYYETKFGILLQYILDNLKNEVQFVQKAKAMKLEMNNKFTTPERSMEYLLGIIKQLIKVVEPETEQISAEIS